MKDSMKNNLKTQYELLSEKPGTELWEKIEEALDESLTSAKKQSVFPKFWKIAAVLFLLISIGVILKLSFQKEEIVSPLVAQKEEVKTPDVQKNLEFEDTVQRIVKNQQKKKETLEKIIIAEVQKEDSKKVEKLQKEDSTKEVKENARFVIKEKEESDKSIKKDENFASGYISADDLIFGRELDKVHQDQQTENKGKLGLELKKPKEIKVLGVTVYTEQ